MLESWYMFCSHPYKDKHATNHVAEVCSRVKTNVLTSQYNRSILVRVDKQRLDLLKAINSIYCLQMNLTIPCKGVKTFQLNVY